MKNMRAFLPGMALAAVIALLAIELGNFGWLQGHGISALTIAIVLGIVVGNSAYPAAASDQGVQFSKQTLLRLGIVLYGIRLTFQDIQHVGISGVVIDTVVVCSTFALAWFLGTRWLGLDRKTAMLIGAGSSICGAAAVMATEPVVRGRADQVTVAVSTVVVFGTIAIFLDPVLYHLNVFGISSPAAYGLFAGSTIHEVAQVVAAGRAIGEQAAATAVITKMVRVMLLAPFLLALSVYLSRETPGDDRVASITIPWFALGFVAVTALNSFVSLPVQFTAIATTFDTFVLAMAMAALGLTTHVSALRSAGVRPLALAGVLFAWLILGGVAINAGVAALLR
jgi:uncharacterized integral membrane protein (TIGR00698 family)